MLKKGVNIASSGDAFMAMNEIINNLEKILEFLEHLNKLRSEIINIMKSKHHC